MRTAILQFQDISGTWSTVSRNVDANDTHLNMRLNELHKRYGGKRVRAIDSETGSVIDIR